MDILILSSVDGNSCITRDSGYHLVLKKMGMRERVLCDEVVTSFDAVCREHGGLELFFTTEGGSLLYLNLKGDATQMRPVMLGKDRNNRICAVKVLYLNGRFHLFYCLDSKNRYLVHQVMSEEILYEPYAIDNVGKRFVYDITTDDSMNIHIVYSSDDGTLRYRKYINSQKEFTDYKKICTCDSRRVCMCICEDRLFAAYTDREASGMGLYIASVLDSEVKKIPFPVSNNTTFCLNAANGGLAVHVAEEGSCCEIKSDLSLNVSRAKPIGRCLGIFDVRCPENKNSVRCYPVGGGYIPLDGYDNFAVRATVSDAMPRPAGSEAEAFAEKYKDEFSDKILKLKEEELFGSLAKIEASLKRLVEIAEYISPMK